ncbi:hypothetical protein ACTXLQ_03600 [Enterococcus hirae]|uniref:hypothetical protein n=1 Tax=Enterococcus hirae TaxID=1354 RepID=UPI002ECE03A8|nr:hypothetical protein [Enterococcus hirae]
MPNKEQEKTKTIQQEPTELNPSTTKEKENSPFISKKRAKELKKFESKVRKKEDKAVKQVIKTVMKDADRIQDHSQIFKYLTYEFKNSPFISKERAEEELKKLYRKKEDKAVKQEIKTVMKDADRTQDHSQIFKYLTYGFEHNPFISKERAEEELKKFKGKNRKKEDKAVERAIKTVVNNRDITGSSVLRYLKNELTKSPSISRQRVEEEMGKYEGGNNVRNSSEVPGNKDRGEDLKEKLNRVSKEENSSPERAAVSQDLQHKQDNPLHR